MSVIKKADTYEEFKQAILGRASNKVADEQELATKLLQYYTGYDYSARRAYVRTALTMYANYENKFYGEIDEATGRWNDDALIGNEVAFSVPLLKPHVDTGITFYCKARPEYEASPRVQDQRLQSLVSMCEKLAKREYDRMFTPEMLQREAQYLFLAGQSFRQIYPAVNEESPLHLTFEKVAKDVPTVMSQCADCGASMDEASEVCPQCLSQNMQMSEGMAQVEVDVPKTVKVPRPQLSIPNPVSVQTDLSAATFKQSGFLVRRRMIARNEAEYFYAIDLENQWGSTDFASKVLDTVSKDPVTGRLSPGAAIDTVLPFASYFNSQVQKVEDCELWLDPSQYALYRVGDSLMQDNYPDGAYLHVVGGKLVQLKKAKRTGEWVALVCGTRPASSNGTGMMHLAEMNELINNAINLEYAVLRTSGFPLTLLRSKYLKDLPEALQTVLLDNLPDDLPLENIVHRVQPANASGMLGVLSNRFEGYMQFAGATWSATGGAADVRDMMGTATGALAVQEMMNDRLGLAVQTRIQADIDSYYLILEQIQQDKSEGNRQLLMREFDAATVASFFEADLRSLVQFKVVKGTEEPKTDAVSTMKAQVFAQMTASLSNLSEIDKPAYLDLISAFGDSLGLPVEIGAGRKEKNLAKNRIALVEMMYKEMGEQQMMIPEDQMGLMLFQQISAQDAYLLQIDPTIEMTLYDYSALAETYSDWLQSNEGQNAPLAVKTAVAMLFSYSSKAQQMKEQQAQQAMMQQQIAMQGAAALINQPPPEEEESEDDKKEDKKEKETDD